MNKLPDPATLPPRIRTDVDFDKAGKQYGHMRVPRAHTHSGLGVIGIPIVSIKNGSGPTYLLTAGTHGDEYDGQVALLNLAREVDPARVQGRIIIIPSLDLPAVEVGHRLCPYDGKDLNRVFPGNRLGSFTEMLADYVTRALLPITDYNMDLHTGGTYHDTAFNTCSHFVDDPKQMKANIDLGLAWGAPYHAVLREIDHTNSFMTTADHLGVPALSCEFGGLSRIGNESLAEIERGCATSSGSTASSTARSRRRRHRPGWSASRTRPRHWRWRRMAASSTPSTRVATGSRRARKRGASTTSTIRPGRRP